MYPIDKDKAHYIGNNIEVVVRFLQRRAGQSRRLTSDGQALRGLGMTIARWRGETGDIITVEARNPIAYDKTWGQWTAQLTAVAQLTDASIRTGNLPENDGKVKSAKLTMVARAN